jgi:hypothetical protein
LHNYCHKAVLPLASTTGNNQTVCYMCCLM